jgi:hypothetical protein
MSAYRYPSSAKEGTVDIELYKQMSSALPWQYRIRAGHPPPFPAIPITIKEDGNKLLANNGRLSVLIDPAAVGFGFASVTVNGTESPAAGPLKLRVAHEGGVSFGTEGIEPVEVRVEERGPLRVVIYLRGRLSHAYEWQTRLVMHANEPAIRAEHTLGGLGDREINAVEQITVEYPVSLRGSFHFRTGGASTEFSGTVNARDSVMVEQVAPSFLPPSDFSYEVSIQSQRSLPQKLGQGGRAAGWIRAEGNDLTAGVAIRDFSEKSPKALRINNQTVSVDLWPHRNVLRLSAARAISHEMMYAFHPTVKKPAFQKHSYEHLHNTALDLPYRSFVQPIIPAIPSEYMSKTQAFGPYLPAACSVLPHYENLLRQSFESWYTRHYDRGIHYGMMNYGDYVAPWPGDNGGNPDRPHWRDHEWEFASALFTYYLRHGDRRAFKSAVAAYKHFMDVDVHYSRRFNFFHSYGDRGEMHEVYYGPALGHSVSSGLIDAYLFTGDRRALHVAKGLGENFIGTFDEGQEATRELFKRELRGVAWPLLGLLRLYEITLEAKYLEPVAKTVMLMNRERDLWMKGGSWQSALLSAVLENHHRLTRDPISRQLFLDHVDWLLDSYYDPKLKTIGPRYKGPPFSYAPLYSSGVPLMLHATSLGYAFELTKDRYYLEVGYQILQEGMKSVDELTKGRNLPIQERSAQVGATRSDGKWFSMLNFYTNRLPNAFTRLSIKERESLKKAQPQRRSRLIRKPRHALP